VLRPFLSVEINDAPLSLASGPRYRCSRDAELQAASSLAAAPFSWEGIKRTQALTAAPEAVLGSGSETLPSERDGFHAPVPLL